MHDLSLSLRGSPRRQQCSDLTLGNSSFELAFAKPVVEGGLSLVGSSSIKECATHEVKLNWFVDNCVNDCFLEASAAGHFNKLKINYKTLIFTFINFTNLRGSFIGAFWKVRVFKEVWFLLAASELGGEEVLAVVAPRLIHAIHLMGNVLRYLMMRWWNIWAVLPHYRGVHRLRYSSCALTAFTQLQIVKHWLEVENLPAFLDVYRVALRFQALVNARHLRHFHERGCLMILGSSLLGYLQLLRLEPYCLPCLVLMLLEDANHHVVAELFHLCLHLLALLEVL